MAVSLPDGSIIAMATGYGVVKAITAITNATPAVATLEATHGIIVNDIMELTSGWSQLSGRIARASVVATNDVTLEKIVTTNTTKFPVGTGIGSIREVTAWTQISQILNATSDGGAQQFAVYRFLEDATQRRIPTYRDAVGMTLSIADDDSLPHWAALVAADEDKLTRAIRVSLPSGKVIYHNGIVSFNEMPSLTLGEVMACEATFSFQARAVRY